MWSKLWCFFFPVLVCGCESWTIKEAEHWRINAFKLWSWRRLLRVPWTARRANQSIQKEINPEYSLEGLMLKLQYFGQLMWRADSLEMTLMLEKPEGRKRRGDRGWDGWMVTQWTWGHESSAPPPHPTLYLDPCVSSVSLFLTWIFCNKSLIVK